MKMAMAIAEKGHPVDNAIRDRFGFGTEAPREDNIINLMEAAKAHMSVGEQMPDDLKEMIYRIPMSGKGLSEDLSEELDTIKSYVAGDFKRRKDNRYEWESLLLKEGETPEAFILNTYPPRA